jgi:hypothetical protein
MKRPSTLISLVIFKTVIIVTVTIIICWTVYNSLSILSSKNSSTLCNVYSPFGGIAIDKNCTSISKITGQTPPLSDNFSREVNKKYINTINSSSTSNLRTNLKGNWTLNGYSRGNIVHADLTLGDNKSYILKGEIVFNDKNFPFTESGKYVFNQNRMIIYFLNTIDNIQSAYILENVKNNSFDAFNPNSLDSLTFRRLAS